MVFGDSSANFDDTGRPLFDLLWRHEGLNWDSARAAG
jgi:hypothetical protein